MRRAIHEAGFYRIVKYLFYRIVMLFYRALLFSPLQTALLRLGGATIGKNTIIEPCTFYNLYVRGFRNIVIGDNVFIGPECMFDLANQITLGNYVTIAARVNVATHLNVGYRGHPHEKNYPRRDQPVSIRDGCFIGTGTTVLPGSSLARNCFIAAGSVVSGTTEENTVYAGSPLRKVKVLPHAH